MTVCNGVELTCRMKMNEHCTRQVIRFQVGDFGVSMLGTGSGYGNERDSVRGQDFNSLSDARCDDVLCPQCRLIHPCGRRFREVAASHVLGV